MITKVVSRAAASELLKGLMAVGADRLIVITDTTTGTDKIGGVRG
jgi:electron transfer flavoprotein alpha/beta subunit